MTPHWKEATVQTDRNVKITTYTRGNESVTQWTQLYGTMMFPGSYENATLLKDILVEQSRQQAKNITVTQIDQDAAVPHKWIIYSTETSLQNDGSYAESNIWCIRVGEVSTFVVHLDVRGGKLDPQLVKTWSEVFKQSSVK